MEAGDRKLKDWRICFTKLSFSVLVEGYLENDPTKQLWRTSNIVRRESSRILYTKSGQRYILVGGINRTAALEKNFPVEMIDQFSNGFPQDWQHILSKHFQMITGVPSSTPIRASKRMIQRMQKKILSSSEDEEEEKVKEICPVIPKKKSKKNKNVQPKAGGGLALKKIRENFREESPDFEVEMVVEHPESDTSTDAAANKENNAVKRWTQAEKQRLLERLKAMNPVKEADWENVQRSKTDVIRTIEEIKDKAKELNWKPRNMQGERVDLEEANTVTIKEITARPGTVDYMMQVEAANRDYVFGKNKAQKNVSSLPPPASAPLLLDDSIISMIKTPENPKRVRYPFQPVPRAYSSFCSEENSTLDESNVSAISTTSTSFMEQDEKAMRRHQKNNIQILKKHR